MTFSLVSGIVAAPPQLKLTKPPPASAASSAASVQLAGLPVPTIPAAPAGLAGVNSVSPASKITAVRLRMAFFIDTSLPWFRHYEML